MESGVLFVAYEEMEHMYKKKLGQTYCTNRHSCFLLQYHIVLVTKYRRPVLTGAVKELVYQVIQDIFDKKDLVILEMNGESDHIHILFEAYYNCKRKQFAADTRVH